MANPRKCIATCLWLSIATLLLSVSCGVAEPPEGDMPSLSWAVCLQIPNEAQSTEQLAHVADELAQTAGLVNKGQIGELKDHYLFTDFGRPAHQGDRASVRAAVETILAQHNSVRWYTEQRHLRRSKRSVTFNDPKYPHQWHLNNVRRPGMDINVTGVWERNVTGQGVTVVVVDDGVEHTLADIHSNYSPEGSYDLNSNDADPMPHPDNENDNHHGTRCAGEIAAVPNNSFCAVGVAYGSRVAGIRVLDGPLTDSMEATAFNKHYQINDIYSCSWGPDDDGKTVDGPHHLGKIALQQGVIAGRRGFGSIFVVASGNGGQYKDNCNYDGYANSIYTVTIGAVDEEGNMPFYAEECASMLAVTFSSGDKLMRSIVTSDWDLQKGTGCTEGHTGTSAAAPIAAGMIALMLQVRPCLTWRDVQHIIVFTATKETTAHARFIPRSSVSFKPGVLQMTKQTGHFYKYASPKYSQYEDRHAVWERNGAGFSHSHQHGFGLLNAWRLVNAAKVWDTVPYLASYTSPILREDRSILQNLELEWNVTAAELEQSGMRTLEHVAVTVTITHSRRGNLEIKLFCPSGVSSLIGATRSMDTDPAGYSDWTFSTVRCWGEEAEGTYRLSITDTGEKPLMTGTLKQWHLTLYGSSWALGEVQDRQRLVEHAMSGQYLDSSFSLPCPPGLKISEKETYRITSNTLKTLLLLGCFTVFWSIYYMLEVYLTRKNLDIDLTCRRSGCGWAQSRGDYRLASSGVDLESGIDMDVLPLCTDKESPHEETPEQEPLPTDSGASNNQDPYTNSRAGYLQEMVSHVQSPTPESLLTAQINSREC